MVARRKVVVNTQPVVESIGPEANIEVGASEKGANGISNSEMAAFDGAVLMRSVRSGWTNSVSKLSKEIDDVGVGIKFAALVKLDIFVGTGWGIL